MRIKAILLFFLAFWTINNLFSQASVYNSEDGVSFPTKGKYRALCVFVNIIYDVTPDEDPTKNGGMWEVANQEGINQLPPHKAFNQLFDADEQFPRQGIFTRVFSESSFDSLVILGDFISVEIKQSAILGGRKSFGNSTLISSVVKFINENGGVKAIHGHDSIADYDNTSSHYKDRKDNKIDLAAFFILNPTPTYGGFSRGQGFLQRSPGVKIKLADGEYGIDNVLNMGIVSLNLSHEPGILVHEFAHALLGGNSFHTSGGNHLSTSSINTFLYKQHGFGLFRFSFRSTNGYERWRLGWQSPSNDSYKIAASGEPSDIEPFEGEQKFYLRDFLTYGDAVRIKLPYKDSDAASNQYIWLENHQVGKNGKLDGINYHFYPDGEQCVPLGNPGIYAYIQVGKDRLQGTYGEVYPDNETDNLCMINAEGNYNMEYRGLTLDCKGWSERPTFEYVSPNPLSGANDQTEVINTTNEKLTFFSDFLYMGTKIKEGIVYNQMPNEGDDFDGFEAGSVLNISSNPTPINAVTHYAYYYSKDYYRKTDNQRDTRKKYLTGLSIRMNHAHETPSGSVFEVLVRWDDYDVKQNVNWAGDIVLKEKLNLLNGKQILLEQNRTVFQLERDSVSGFFAPPTQFTCEEGAEMDLKPLSKITLKDKSSLIMENGAKVKLQDKAKVVVEEGSTLIIKKGASLTIEGEGEIRVKKGGFICIETGATLNFADKKSVISLEKGAFWGANPSLFDNVSCSGKGKTNKKVKIGKYNTSL